MRTLLTAWLLLGFFGTASAQPGQLPAPADFWARQLAFPRVRTAYAHCWPTLAARLQAQHLDSARLEVFFGLSKPAGRWRCGPATAAMRLFGS